MLMVNMNIIQVRRILYLNLFNLFFNNLVKHVLNPLGLAKYEIRQNNDVIADVK